MMFQLHVSLMFGFQVTKTALHTIIKKRKKQKQYLHNPNILISVISPCYYFSKGATIPELRDTFQRKGDGREVKGNECRQQEGKEKVRE